MTHKGKKNEEAVKAVAGVIAESLEETRSKFDRYWNEPGSHRNAVSFALGLFSGIVIRRLQGQPDPDPAEKP